MSVRGAIRPRDQAGRLDARVGTGRAGNAAILDAPFKDATPENYPCRHARCTMNVDMCLKMEDAVTDSLLLPTDVGAAISLREMAYSWEGDALTAERARVLESLTARGLQLASGLELAWSLATAAWTETRW